MPLYDFRPRFADQILAGTKRQTIRKPRSERSRHAREGDLVHLYTGLRTKASRKLGAAPCIGVDEVRLNFLRDRVTVTSAIGTRPILQPADLDDFAREDGLADWADMKATFREIHGADLVEFWGCIIYWGKLL